MAAVAVGVIVVYIALHVDVFSERESRYIYIYTLYIYTYSGVCRSVDTFYNINVGFCLITRRPTRRDIAFGNSAMTIQKVSKV